LKRALNCNVPVIAMTGELELSPEEIKSCGLLQAYCINPHGTPLNIALVNAHFNLRTATAKMASEILRSMAI